VRRLVCVEERLLAVSLPSLDVMSKSFGGKTYFWWLRMIAFKHSIDFLIGASIVDGDNVLFNVLSV